MLRRDVLLGAAVLGWAGSPAQAQTPGPAISVPITIFRQKIMFPVTLGGRSVTAIYDSGAARSVLSRAVAETMGLDLGGRGRATGFGGGANLQLARDVDAEIGGAVHRYAQLVVVDLAHLTAPFGREIELIVGVDVFPQRLVDVDVAAGRLSFVERAGWAPPPGTLELVLDNRANNFTTQIVINGVAAQANFDLGAGNALDIGPALAQRLGIARGALPTGQATGIGGDLEVELSSVASVELAGQSFADVPVQLPAAPLPTGDANLGFPLLSRFRIFLDYRRARAWLEPHLGAEARPFERDLAGLRVARARADRLQIVHVGRASPAAVAGLNVGDEIAAIDGVRISEWPQGADVRAWSSGVDGGRSVRLSLADGREAALTLARFY